MSRLTKYLAVVFLAAAVSGIYADETGDTFNKAKSLYYAQNYASSVRMGTVAVDMVCRTLIEKMLDVVPQPDQFVVFRTNYFYAFNGQQASVDSSIRVEKVMSNANDTLSVAFDNSLSAVQSAHSLLLGFDYLQNSGSYAKTNYATRFTNYTCLIDNNTTAYIPFVYSLTNGMIQSGVVLQVGFKFQPGLSSSQKRKRIDNYMTTILKLLKTGTLKYYLQ